jgi:hypothetical protein
MNTADFDPEHGRRSHAGYIVVGVIFAGSFILAGVFVMLLMSSEEHLWASQLEMQAEGGALSVDECVDRVMEWRSGCSALETLCDQTVDPMVDTCLQGRDRKQYCSTVTEWTGTTGFEFAQCDKRGVQAIKPAKGFWDRMLFGGGRQTPQRKACRQSYRAVAVYCEGRTVVEIM